MLYFIFTAVIGILLTILVSYYMEIKKSLPILFRSVMGPMMFSLTIILSTYITLLGSSESHTVDIRFIFVIIAVSILVFIIMSILTRNSGQFGHRFRSYPAAPTIPTSSAERLYLRHSKRLWNNVACVAIPLPA